MAAQPILAYAQSSPVTAQVDRKAISLNQTVNLIITVEGGNSLRPPLPVIDGLAVVRTSSASQTNIVGGKISSQVSYRFTLQPTREGELVIPPISVEVDGQSYSTEQLTVQVSASATPPQGSSGDQAADQVSNASTNNDIFVEASVDNPAPYLGEQVTYSFRLYQGVSLFDTPEYDGPDFTGFWNQEEVDQQSFTQQVDNRGYRVTELRTILFPTVIGENTIEPAKLSVPNSIFQKGFQLQTEPIIVNVKPLPEPIPEDFSGSVGQLTLSATAQSDAESDSDSAPASSENLLTVQVDEPVTLQILLEGTGNFEAFGEVNLPTLPTWRAFDSTTQSNTHISDGILRGNLAIEQLLVPVQPGEYELPAIQYIYFDPQVNAYQTTASSPIRIRVEGEALQVPSPLPRNETIRTAPGDVHSLDADIRYIKAVPALLAQNTRPLTQRPAFWLLWLGPLALLVGDWRLRQRQSTLLTNPIEARRSRALRQAQRQLKQAKAAHADPASSASQVLMTYLDDKLAVSVSGLTHTELGLKLREEGIEDQVVARIQHLLAFSEMSRFAPGQSSHTPETIWSEVTSLLNALEQALP
ncbi:MAG: BatD family protein [Chloroflexota bacterium]